MSDNQLPRVDCPFCNWRGPNNKYPGHLAECSHKTAADDTRAGTALRTDGGRPDLEPGDRAVDREDRDKAVVVVVFVHDATAGEYTIEALGETVSGVNPGYSPRDRVVEAVYLDEAEAALGEWADTGQLRDAVAFDGVRSYSFPEGRLRPLDDEEGGGDDEDDGSDGGGLAAEGFL